jgi:GntR family transcriptional regulator
MIEHVALPAAIFPDLDKRPDRFHRVVVLAQRYGILLGKATETLRVAAASSDTATALELAPGSAVLALDRLVFSLDGRPIEWRIGHCNLRDKQYVTEMN